MIPKYLPYLRGVPLGRNVNPAALDPASNPGVVVDDRVCNSGRAISICGICAGMTWVRGRIP